MKSNHIVVIFVSAVCCCTAMSQEQAAVNLALVAKPSTSYVSGDTSVNALNDGIEPRRSGNRRDGSYGNWPRRNTQWVQYDWDVPISTNKIDVFWWDDRQGVRLPAAARLLYWDGSGLWCCAKRLAKGRFSWPHTPEEQSGALRIVAEELTLLLSGIDLDKTRTRRWWSFPMPDTSARRTRRKRWSR